MSRRRFLRFAGLSLAAGALAACKPAVEMLTPTPGGSTALPTATPTRLPAPAGSPTLPAGSLGEVDVEIALRAVESSVSIYPGTPTRVWQFQGEVLRGDPNALQFIPDSYLGPIFRLRKGQKVRIHFTNEIPEPSIVHWHGMHVPAEMDGHPRYVINKGNTYVYEFEVLNRAGTYWYHPHPHGRTGPQVYMGMAGFFLVTDDEEQALNLPSGEYDVPLVIQDRIFDADNQLVYLPNGMMDRMMGFLGNEILVNGKPNFTLSVATRPYRLRILNGSNSRIYKLGWEDGTPLTVIGNDGGLLEKPVQKPYVVLGPGERVDLWVDFSAYKVGTRLTFQNLPYMMPGGAGGMGGGMRGGMRGGGMMGGRSGGNMRTTGAVLGLGDAYPIFTVQVERKVDERQPLPSRLSTITPLPLGEAVNASRPRRVELVMRPMVGWTLNGRTFEMTAVAEDEIVRLNTIEVWEFVNIRGGGMMDSLPHPMHMHGEQFQVLERRVDPAMKAAWETLKDGFVDEGWKDTVLVTPGESVKVIRRFGDFTGLFLYHCHNLEHEDMGMMRNFEIRA